MRTRCPGDAVPVATLRYDCPAAEYRFMRGFTRAGTLGSGGGDGSLFRVEVQRQQVGDAPDGLRGWIVRAFNEPACPFDDFRPDVGRSLEGTVHRGGGFEADGFGGFVPASRLDSVVRRRREAARVVAELDVHVERHLLAGIWFDIAGVPF